MSTINEKIIKELRKTFGKNLRGWSNVIQNDNVIIVYIEHETPFAPQALYVDNKRYEIKMIKLGKVKAL